MSDPTRPRPQHAGEPLDFDRRYDDLFEELEAFTRASFTAPEALAAEIEYMTLHRNRFKSDLRLIARYHKSGEILEIGGDPYHMTFFLKRLGYPVVTLNFAAPRHPLVTRYEMKVVACDIERERFPFDDDHFQYVQFSEVFEHLRIDPISVLKEIRRVLQPGGVMVLTTPNLYSTKNLSTLLRGRGIAYDAYDAFNSLHTQGYTGHVREYAASELKRFVTGCGFRVLDVQYTTHTASRGSALSPLINGARRFFPGVRPFLAVICEK